MNRYLDLLREVSGAEWVELDLLLEGTTRPTRYGRGTRRGAMLRMLLEMPGSFRANVRHDGEAVQPGTERLLRFCLDRILATFALEIRLDLVTEALDATSSAVLLFDAHDEIAYANPRAEELLARQTMGELRIETGQGREEPLIGYLTRLLDRVRKDGSEKLTGRQTLSDGTQVAWELARLGPVTDHDGHAVLCVVRTACPADRKPAPSVLAAFNLTRREREVVEHLLCGLSTREIADRMGISHHTVRDHVKHLLRKTATRSRRELLELVSSGEKPVSVPAPGEP